MVVFDVQRAGPSTGMPTKTEQSDLLMAIHGRHGEAPLAVLAAATPADCFAMAFEAVRLATKYMTPVMVLSDSFLSNGAEPWRIVDPDELPDLHTPEIPSPEQFAPYRRDPKTLARPWVAPGTPGYEHRIGGLEKTDVTGAVSYDAVNHQRMVNLRAEKIERIAHDIPPGDRHGLGQGRSAGRELGQHLRFRGAAVSNLQEAGRSVDHLHLRYLNPFPANLGKLLKPYQRILVPENNMGQLCTLLRAKYLVDAQSLAKVEGRAFRVSELIEQIGDFLGETK